MRKAFLLCLSLFVMPIFVGCGGSDEFSGTTIQNNSFTSLLPVLSGQVGSLRLQTTLESVNAQSISIVTSNVIPTVVDEFRFLGFNADGVLIYGPVIRTKSANITLDQVPVEVVSLRIELLTEGLIVGGLSTAVDINTGEIFLLNNPTFSFPQGATGPTGPTGPAGTVASAYGSYRGTDQSVDSEEDIVVNFEQTLAQLGVTSSDDGETFTVAAAGDYLFTFDIYGFFEEETFAVRVNGSTIFDTRFFVSAGGTSVSFILPLAAGDDLSLVLSGGEGSVQLFDSSFTIVRLGEATGTLVIEE